MLSLVFSLIGRILAWLINAYITVLFVRMILDWVSVLARNWYPRGVVAQLINIVYSITEPSALATSLYSPIAARFDLS